MDENEGGDENLGLKEISDKLQARIPDEALEKLNAQGGDHIGFKNCDEPGFIKVCKVEVDF